MADAKPRRSTTAWIRERFKKSVEASTAALPAAEPLPSRVGRYRVLERVGRGSIANVYRAEDENGRRVAVKVMRPDQAGADAEAVFRHEGKLLSELRHLGLVALHEVGTDGSGLYLVMDFVEGPTLQAALDREMPREELLPILVEVAQSVGFAHRHGVIHRDLKPQNILLGAQGPVVTDFGIARAIDAVTRTTRQIPIGTPTHMAPEQIDRKLALLGPATDVWALGVMLYQILCGRLPFMADDVGGVYRLILREEPVPPHRVSPQVSEPLEGVCMRALRKEPRERPSSAAVFADELLAAIEGRRPETPVPWWKRLFGRGGLAP